MLVLHFDWAVALIELTGGKAPENWDGKPFTAAFQEGHEEGRPYLVTSQRDVNPMMTVLREGGPFHTRGMLPNYLKRLHATGRTLLAERLERLHPNEI